MTKNQIKKLENLISAGHLAEAIGILDREIELSPDDPDLYFRRGKINWRLGRRPAATSDYLKATALDPESPAREALEFARRIESFYNPDLLNP
ncbi:MAG: hypothetical protein NC336_07170 [Clostridium sp.]|nr:hypothetical protein [Clostridium sp.]